MRCQNCDSKKITTVGKGAVLIVMWLFASFFMFAGIFFFPLWIIAALLLFGSPIAFFVKPVSTCSDCKYKFKAA